MTGVGLVGIHPLGIGAILAIAVALGVVIGMLLTRRRLGKLERDVLYLATAQEISAEALEVLRQAWPNVAGGLGECRKDIALIKKRLDDGQDGWKKGKK
jgi:hypothetical protein